MKDRLLFVLALMVFATMTHPGRSRPRRGIAENLLGRWSGRSRRTTVPPFATERTSPLPPFANLVDDRSAAPCQIGQVTDERVAVQPETGLVNGF